MPNQILQVDENMLETKLDRLVSEKVEQLLNAMLDAEADEITGACRRSYTLECKTNAARRALEGEPLARVARDAGCTPTSVYQWMRRYRSEGILGLMDRRNAPMPAEPMPAAGDDVEELRRQVEVLRLENAVMRETIDVVFCQVGVGRFGVSFSPCERRVSGRFGVGRSCWLLVIALVIA